MQNGVGKEQAEQPAPSISPDFLTGSAETGLERIRTRLLDLTNRNKLLNFKHTGASALRVVDVFTDPVFRRLRDNERLPFLPVPEPNIDGEVPSAKDYADELGWNTSFDLDDAADEDNTKSLPVLLYQEKLDVVSRKIASAAKTAIEESGTNMLYLVFGFLEWYESDNSQQAHIAPLVILPVIVDRTGGKGRAVETVLEYSGEDLESNLSLVEKMRRDFGLEIPLLGDDDTPEVYFAKFADILKLKKHWSIRRQITLALLSFGKLLMYRDLDPKTWPIGQSLDKHKLVRELFEGSKNPNIARAEEFAIDEPELKEEVPDLIRDADSSQHSALVQALRGHNLVIEGPPGTGKSQTITNLIAAALARGKTVLFVSEKLAALEVVRGRLDDVGLGGFCLEVHSHKTKKGALLNDVAQRIRLRGSFKDPRDLDRHFAIADEKKALLTRYASLVNKTIEPFKATVFEILWARDRSGQNISAHRDRLGKVILPDVVNFTRTQFSRTEQFLSVYEQHLAAVLSPRKSTDQHPWAWIANPLDFAGEERLQALLEEFLTVFRGAETSCERLEQVAGIALPLTLHGLKHAARISAVLPTAGAFAEDLLAPCQSEAARQILGEFIGNVESFSRGVESLSASVSDAKPLLDRQIAAELASALECLRQQGLEQHSVAEVTVLLEAGTRAAMLLEEARHSFRALLTAMRCDAPATLTNTGLMLEAARVIETAPFEYLHLRHPSFESEQARPMLQAVRQQAAALKNDEECLRAEYDLSLCPGAHPPAHLLRCAAVLDRATLRDRLFGRDYRLAVETYCRIVRTGKKAPRAQMSRSLRTVADYTQRRKHFDDHAGYGEMLGPHFRGVNSPWEALDALLSWYEKTLVALPEYQPESEPFRHLAFTARGDHLKAVKASLASAQDSRAALAQAVTLVVDFLRAVPSQRHVIVSESLDEILVWLRRINRDLSDVLVATSGAAISQDVPLREVRNVLAIAAECRDAAAAIEGSEASRALIGNAWQGVHTDTEPLKRTVKVAEAIASSGLPGKAVQWLLCPDFGNRLSDLYSWLGEANACGASLQALAEEIATLSGSPQWSGNADRQLGSPCAIAKSALADLEELPRWNHFLRVRIESKERALDRVTAMAEFGTLKPDELAPAFRFVFYNTLARSVFAEHPELSHVTGLTQEQLRRQFVAADKESIRLYSDRAAALIDQHPVPDGNRSGPVRTWTDMALIINEINKQKRQIPIRQLILRAANALLALKPCFMMGPLSVAQYLAPGQLKFDLVVMDEASQLKPEDAIGAIARGAQIVIVGDPKQLPPTSFFQRVALDAEDDDAGDDRAAVEEGESILDVASTLFQPVRRLRWHYRSRHHSLIAFSNNEFYQRNLIIFPSAYHDDPSLGVKHHSVPNGIFENGRNPREAAVVVDAVLEHMRRNPDESLGVVTLNFEQRELVEELLDRQLRDDPAAIAYQERMKGGQEMLFVKNLENVQGDERDVIFISTTYGSDALGNQFQRFGPINGPSGHRRLNTLYPCKKTNRCV